MDAGAGRPLMSVQAVSREGYGFRSSARGRRLVGAARYAGPWFEAARMLGLRAGLGQPDRLGAFVVAALSRPTRLAALAGLLALTPTESVAISCSDAGAALRRYLDERFLGVFPQNRLCRGVLLLPRDHRSYLVGRHRQALRTNLRRATRAGIHCEVVHDADDALTAVTAIIARRRRRPDDLALLLAEWAAILARPEMTIFLARDANGDPLALAAVVIDQELCLIQIAIACDHAARWALHDHIVRALIQRGARLLFAEGGGPFGALGFESELYRFQRLLGYELRHLAPRR
jgi:hypothetical protein